MGPIEKDSSHYFSSDMSKARTVSPTAQSNIHQRGTDIVRIFKTKAIGFLLLLLPRPSWFGAKRKPSSDAGRLNRTRLHPLPFRQCALSIQAQRTSSCSG